MSNPALRTHHSVYNSPNETLELIAESRESIRRFARTVIDIRVTKRIRDPPLYAHTILEALLDHAPTLRGQLYVASAILAQENDVARLTELSRLWLNSLLSPIRARGQYITQPASSQTPILEATSVEVPKVDARHQPGYRKLLLERHGYKCAVSLDTYDERTPSSVAMPESFISRKLHAVHIMPFCLTNYDGPDSREVPANTWNILEDWAGISSATLSGKKINDLSNLILMSAEVHEDFGSFRFWLEPTTRPHTYSLHLQERQIRFQWASSISFSDQSDRGLPLPMPEFLAIHAAFAKVFHDTGAGRYIDHVWWDAEESGVLKSRSSELKSSLDPQIKSEIQRNVVEVKSDPFIRAFLYPSSALGEPDPMMERDLRLAKACHDMLRKGTPKDKDLKTMLTDPGCPRYKKNRFSLLDSDVDEEKDLYDPFRKLFTLISTFYRKSLAQEPEPFDVDDAWHAAVDPNPLKAMKARSSASPLRRDFFKTYKARLKFSPRFARETADLEPDLILLLHDNKDPSAKLTSFYWKDVKVSIEVKKDFSSEGAIITQMARYARAMLMEQFDRNFVLTVSLSATQCRLFHWDSVGCHTTEIIDIHKNPVLFIQCIGRLAIMTPAELGFDEHFSNAGRVLSHQELSTTTTLTVGASKIPKYFERKPQSLEETEPPPSEPPAPMLLELDTKNFLFESRGLLFHRRTRVWSGTVVLDAEKWTTGRTHVVKQNWAEDTRPCEGYFYRLADEIPTIPSLLRMEECDHTWDYHTRVANEDVIGYLKATARERKPELQPQMDMDPRQVADPSMSSNIGSGANARDRSRTPLNEGPEEIESLERVLLRFVFEEEYRPLSEALSSVEVLHATVQWIQGLIDLDRSGIVHRDISYSNLMLPTIDEGYDSYRWSSGELEVSKMAQIIDLGLAHWAEAEPSNKLPASSLRAPSIIPGTSTGIQKSSFGSRVDIRQGDSFTPDVSAPRAHHHITGTLPFIALSLIQKLQGVADASFVEHALHHDVESVFWVLVYLCHERAGIEATEIMKSTLKALNSADIYTVSTAKSDIINRVKALRGIVGPFWELREFLQHFADYCRMCSWKEEIIDATTVLKIAVEHRDKLVEKWKGDPASMPVYQPPARSPRRLRPATPVDAAKRKSSTQQGPSDFGEREEESPEEGLGTPRKKCQYRDDQEQPYWRLLGAVDPVISVAILRLSKPLADILPMANTNSESKRLRYNDGKKTALMLVDIQYDFLPGGALAVTDGDKILPVVYGLLDRFDWDLVVASAGGDFESGVQSRLDASPSKVAVIRKGSHLDIDSYSAFADNAYLVFTDLPKTLYSNGIERLVVVGLATDFCVRATAIDSRKFNFETIVISDGIRGVFADREEAVLNELSSWGAKVQTLREYENEAS
ncbi:hypothetical protein FRC01_001251 [Tulasnella sp. 417]|nr:hypothetical protein FRC01_001251 [Tulasnella sp. 417]